MSSVKTNLDSNSSEIIVVQSVTIVNTQSLSNFVRFKQTTFVGYIIPAGWTTANLTFQASTDDSTFIDISDNFGNEIQHVVDTGYILFDPSIFAGVRVLKVRSGTSSTPVAQGADRIIQILSRPL